MVHKRVYELGRVESIPFYKKPPPRLLLKTRLQVNENNELEIGLGNGLTFDSGTNRLNATGGSDWSQHNATEDVNMSGGGITNMGGTGDSQFDVATKGYVDSAASGGILYNVKENGAVGDGRKDERTAFETTITKAVNNGGGTMYVTAGEYVLENLTIDNSNITILGDGATSTLQLKKIRQS